MRKSGFIIAALFLAVGSAIGLHVQSAGEIACAQDACTVTRISAYGRTIEEIRIPREEILDVELRRWGPSYTGGSTRQPSVRMILHLTDRREVWMTHPGVSARGENVTTSGRVHRWLLGQADRAEGRVSDGGVLSVLAWALTGLGLWGLIWNATQGASGGRSAARGK